MKRFLTIFAAAAALLVAGCQKAEVEDNLNIGSSTIVVSNAGATQDIVFTANADWTIASDQAWVTFDREKGAAGKVTVTLTIAANEGTDDRSAKVTVKAGTKETVFNIEQKALTGFESVIVYNIDEKAQDITIAVKYNVDYKVVVAEDSPWLTVTKTKAAPVEGSIVVRAAANSQLGSREGSFAIVGDNFSQTYKVVQSAAWTPTVKASGRFLGRREYLYKDNAYQTAEQFAVDLETEEGDVITLVLNIGDGVEDPLAVPVGSYVADEGGTLEAGTFAIKGNNKFYTGIVTAKGSDVSIEDGEVTVADEGDEVSITAALVDNNGVTWSYSYAGAFASVKDDFEVMTIPSADKPKFNSCTNTYYKTKANEWTITFWATAAPSEGVPALAYIPVTLYSEAGDPASLEIPEGTYTFTDVELDYSKNGNSDFEPGTFTISMNTSDQIFYKVLNKDATLTLTKNEDGTYKFDLRAKIGDGYYFDADYNQVNVDGTYDYHAAWDNVVIPEAEEGVKPYPDVDTEFKTVMTTQVVWVGTPISDKNLFFVSFSSVDWNFTANFALCVDKEAWEFVPMEGRTSYTEEPVPDGVYKFSKTPGNKTLIPVTRGATAYYSIANSWTGTTSLLTGGTLELKNGSAIFNLEAKAGENTIKFTGTLPFAPAYGMIRDRSAWASSVTLVTE